MHLASILFGVLSATPLFALASFLPSLEQRDICYTLRCPTNGKGQVGKFAAPRLAYTCAYANGACSWEYNNGPLLNYGQPNCPQVAPCTQAPGGTPACTCVADLDGGGGQDIGVKIVWNCLYDDGGVCVYDENAVLQSQTPNEGCPNNLPSCF